MNRSPTGAVVELLKSAQETTDVVLTIDGRPAIVDMDAFDPPGSIWEARRSLDRYLDEAEWRTDGPEFARLREWVETHWDPREEKPAPAGTVAIGDRWGRQGEDRLDAASAARKLIAAAKLYGREEIGKHAAEFAAHGTIPTRIVYLLKGPPLETAKPLDDFCTLLPYAEALRRIEAESDPGDNRVAWPEPNADNVCGLECRHFERIGARDDRSLQYTSPLLKDGVEALTLLLGLVWGCGFRVFANWNGVPAAAVAALPYRYTTLGRSAGSCSAALAIPGLGPPVCRRPLAVTELHGLAAKYSALPAPVRHRLRRAMARLRDSAERIDGDDRTIDLGIALHVLCADEDEMDISAALVAQKAAWLHADSEEERRRTEDMLGRFLHLHSEIVHGRAPDESDAEACERGAEMLSGADDVLRTCLKSLIAEGLPEDWDRAADPSAFRRDPPRPETATPSVKSDSLSWSVAELREIDRALEAVWKPIVDEAPLPPAGVGPVSVQPLTPASAERYREEGIPYVVIHPARLYEAHPKWPGTRSEPLDERTLYYCEQDVARHTMRWQEAAAHRGLVSIEAPTDAMLYRPEHRDRWPRPLYSSHEPDPDAEIPDRPPEIAEAVVSDTSASDAREAEPVAAGPDQPPDPPSEHSASVKNALEREWPRLWRTFRHDVNVATDSLLHMLDAIHSRHLAERWRLERVVASSDGKFKTVEDACRIGVNVLPAYPKLRAFPVLTGEPLFRRTAPGGSMEQAVLKGWICDVYGLWESRYRTQLRRRIRGLPGAIRPEQQVIGDLGHIRNDLVHNDGVAKGKQVASCKVLRWFAEGERMQLRLRHVFDFLNQMGWLHEGPIFFKERGVASYWFINRAGDVEDPPPALISVRPAVHPEQEDPRHRFEAGMVFENGLFGRTPMGPEHEESEEREKETMEKWKGMTVNADGDLDVPGVGTASAAALYRSHLEGERRAAPGLWQPAVRFRKA